MSREVEAEFVAFHRAYPGRKRGYRQELAVLARRRPRDWREVVGQLAPALERLLRWRERAAAAGMYVASHKNLSTWLNQECWTEEFPDIDNPQTLSANENPTTPVGADADRRRLDYAEHIARHLDAGETSEPDIAGLL